MSTFEEIRPFYDTEVNDALREIIDHPMLKSIMNFTFPEMPDETWKSQLLRCYSIRDFQINFIYPALTRILEVSSEGLRQSQDSSSLKKLHLTFSFRITAISFWIPRC
ncbi:hypothetical protein [Nitritalea halalkaliphila]|uniref:hypothetical protein n=1 Tax=Nitritalea halalkaliphila TaxID=590849 RepID=UPI00031A96D8|nr:hypothetical protein [Nitritalea halalkaliphila]